MLLDFFSKHKGVSGSISIMLSWLLLPLLTLFSVMIESARYQSAKEQLDELTYLGELAILADYVDFLQTKYDIYAFDGTKAADSFEEYVEYAQNAGGVDTTKLNKLFEIDMDSCSIEGMYSAADPKVIEYQIKQSGRYMMPADILSEVTLEVIFKDINKKLEGVSKKLAVIGAVAEEAANVGDILGKTQDLNDETQNLMECISRYKATFCNDYTTKTSNKNNWGEITDAEFETIKGYTDEQYTRDNDYKNKIDEFKEALDRVINDNKNKEAINNYVQLCREYNEINEREDYDGKQKELEEKQKEKKEVTITISTSTDDSEILCSTIKISTSYNYEDFMKDFNKNLLNNFSDALPDFDVDNLKYDMAVGIYTNISNSLGKKSDEIQQKLDNWDEWKGVVEAIESYNNLAGYVKGDLKEAYHNYITAVEGFLDQITKIVDSYYAIEAAEKKSAEYDNEQSQNNSSSGTVKKTDEQENAANVKKVDDVQDEYIDKAKEEITEKKEELKGKQKTTEDNESFKKAVEEKNYEKIGQNVLEKFTKDITKGKLDKWKYTYDNYADGLTYLSIDTCDEFNKAVKELKDFNANENLIKEFSAFSNTEYGKDGCDNVIDELEDLSEENKDDYLENGDLESIYKNVPADKDLNDTWFSAEDNQCYYFSSSTIVMLVAFMGAEVKLDDNDSGIFEVLQTLVKAFKNLFPADCKLKAHIGSGAGTIEENCNEFPSYQYNHHEIESNGNFKNTASAYAKSIMENQENTNGEKYYVYEQGTADASSDDPFENLFAGRQPGESIMSLIEGAAGVFDAVDQFINNMLPLRIMNLFKAVGKLCKSILNLIKGLILFVADIIIIVYNLITDFEETIGYFIDQIYIAYYIQNKFSNRQSSTKDSSGAGAINLDPHCSEDSLTQGRNESCVSGDKFKGAQQEYLLIGKQCEISNQRDTYYGIFVIRFLLNFITVNSNELIAGARSIPVIGPFVPFLADYAESLTDMMFMLMGWKVPVIKDKVNIELLVTKLKSPESRTAFINTATGILNGTDKSGNNLNDYFISETEKTTGYSGKSGSLVGNGANDTIYIKKEKGEVKVTIQFDYGQYINLLLFFYPADVKAERMADIMQMEGSVKDKDFQLKNCYTYVGADVTAQFYPAFSLYPDKPIGKLKNVQMNGY